MSDGLVSMALNTNNNRSVLWLESTNVFKLGKPGDRIKVEVWVNIDDVTKNAWAYGRNWEGRKVKFNYFAWNINA